MNNAASTFIHVYILRRTYVSYVLGNQLGVELLGHIITLFHFLRNCKAVPRVTAYIHEQYVIFQFLHIFTSHPSEYEEVLLNSISLMSNDVEHLFMCFHW